MQKMYNQINLNCIKSLCQFLQYDGWTRSVNLSGNLICNDPRPGIQTCMPTRKKGEPPSYLWREVPVAPQENRIVIFPAWLWHSVNPNESNTERISVSFNFIQRGFE